MKTQSELAAEELFESWGAKAEKILESKEKSPDYRVHLRIGEIIFEVKQFEPAATDVESHKDLEKNGFSISESFTLGSRVRKKITDAAPQLKQLAKGRCPAVLLLYNNRPFEFGNPANSYEVLVAMYGLETLEIDSTSSSVVGRKFGGSRKLTAEHNTTISALAVLDPSTGNSELIVYHNIFASMPIEKGLFAEYGALEFTIPHTKTGKFEQWVQVTVS